jgi:hypothetical protein
MLFSHEDSRQAARVFLTWFREKGGRFSKHEINAFGYELASGKLGTPL